jgi:hypothetical protein
MNTQIQDIEQIENDLIGIWDDRAELADVTRIVITNDGAGGLGTNC